MGLSARLRRAIFPGREMAPLIGSTRREISGSLAETVAPRLPRPPAPLRTREISTTCGSTARANGPGSVGRMWSTNRGLTGLSAQLARATFPGHDSNPTDLSGNLNDLWEFSAGQWTWMGGSNVNGQPGTYGTEGTAAASNVPGARSGAVSWTDSSGNFWLFGGAGLDSADNSGRLNDLWKYGAGQWTWVGGSNVNGQLGTYGSVGMGGPSNIPGARTLGVSWTDASGNFWLFGGTGYDWLGSNGFLNDLWQFKP